MAQLLDYRMRCVIKYRLGVVSSILLLKPSGTAGDSYHDDEVHFRYRLIKSYELEAAKVMDEGPLCLMPLVPLMKGGSDETEFAEKMIFDSDLSKRQRGDMLSVPTILSGLISEDLPAKLIARRRDIMEESAAFKLIIEEGRKEGLEEGRKEGKRKGTLELVRAFLVDKFGDEGKNNSINWNAFKISNNSRACFTSSTKPTTLNK